MPTNNASPYIVYADDDKDDLELMQECFDRFNQNVTLFTFDNGHAAYTHLSSIQHSDPAPCLIILDINMPIMDGKETAQKIRCIQKLARVPIVLFTTSSQPHDKIFARQFDIGFITKPLNYKQMGHIAENFISHCTDEVRRIISLKAI